MNAEDTINLDIPANGLFNTLLNLNDGEFVPELEDSLRELVTAVRQHRKKGKLTITIGAGMLANYDDVLNVTCACTLTTPKPERHDSIMFPDNQGGLLTTKPEQKPLDFERSQSSDSNVSKLTPSTSKDT